MESNDKFVFSKPQIVWGYLASFENMKNNGQLCDVAFKVGNMTISAHRVILAAGIPYFKDIFTARDSSEKLEIAMAQTEPQALESLVNYAYTAEVEISTENVLSLFSASAFLGLDEIQDACFQFISMRLSIENVMKVQKVAEDLNYGALVERSELYIVEHFGQFSQTDDFLAMPFSRVKKLIHDDHLAVESEEEVFEAVMKWIASPGSKRLPLLPELLKGVRMTLLSPTYLFETVASNERIRESIVCRDLLDEVKFHMLLPEKRHLFRSFSSSRRHSCKKIYTVCTTRLGCRAKYYNWEDKNWSTLTANDRSDQFVDVIVHNDKIYLFGGKVFGSLHLKNHKWDQLEAMHEHTCGAGVALHSDKIYVFGSSSHHLSRQVCCYDTFRNTWQKEGSMIDHRSRPGVVSMGDKIYIVGGYPDGMSWDSGVHQSVERYDPQEKNSHSLPPMLFGRYWFGICALKDRIYVSGGCDKDKRPYSSVEVFDPESNQWSLISSMNIARYSISLVSFKKEIYAVGGKLLDGRSTNKVEIYDPESNSWRPGVSLDIDDDSLISVRACSG